MDHRHLRHCLRVRAACAALALSVFVPLSAAQASTQNASSTGTTSIQQAIGVVKAITDHGLMLNSDAGQPIRVVLPDTVRILRVAPGQKDLKGATPLEKQDLQAGDRVLVRGMLALDGQSLTAAAVIVMKQGDVAAKQEKDREEWQRHGVGGLVTVVDPTTGTITISTTSFSGSKSIAVHITKDTILRRYAPNSVKFDDAKIAPLDQIKVGDQLRVRGTKNEAGTELTAQEVVSGTFRNLAGTITALDPASSSLTLKDVFTRQAVVVKITGDAQLRKLPPEFAQRIAMRLKGGAGEGSASSSAGSGAVAGGAPRAEARPQGGQFGGPPGGVGEGHRNGGPPDIQQILSRMPTVTVGDLQKGDAVMIVSTQSDSSGQVKAVTLLAGVEALLTASPNATQAMMLSPWSLSSSNAEAAAANP